MLGQILAYIHNWFVTEIVTGDYVISNGSIDLDFLQEGQYFRIFGSVFNDGVHQYPANDLKDESFSGVVWAMAVPPEVIALCDEIKDWEAKYGEAVNSPYQSESFGGYSYSKASASYGNGTGSVPVNGWRSAFASRLNRWRKIR